MKKYRIFGVLFVLVAIISTVTIAKITAADKVNISAEDVTAQYTNLVEIPVNLNNNTDLLGFGFEVSFDEDYLEPASVESGSLITSGTFDDSIGTKYENPFRVVWAGTDDAITTNGELFVLKFKAKKSGSTTVTISGMKDDTYDSEYNKMDSNIVTVKVDVVCEHNYVKTIKKEATCTEEGIAAYTCSVCGDYYEEYIEKKAHDYAVTITDATCTKSGLKEYKCKDCGYGYSEVIKATGHDYKVTETPATCTSKGHTDYECKNCGYSYSENIDALGHDYHDIITEPTCTSKGYTTHTCSRCDDSYVDSFVDMLDHNYVTVSTLPTCTTRGFDTHTCSLCGDSYIDNYIAALGHTIVKDDYKAPTCIETGLTEGSHCSVCGDTIVAQQVIPKLEHVYEKEIIAPTCTEKGYTKYTCKHCHDSYIEDEVPALGHDYEVILRKEPTVDEMGMEVHKCKLCGDTYTVDIPKLDPTTAAPEESTTEAVSEESTTKKPEESTSVKQEESSTIGEEYTTAKQEESTSTESSSSEEQTTKSGEVTTKQTTVVVNNKTTKIKKVVAKKKSITVRWKKVNGVKGYQIQYSLKKSFKKAKFITINKVKVTSRTIKKLNAKKKYFVRIRTFIDENGTKVYSKWSKIKAKRTK